MDVHISEHRHLRVARVHATHVAAQRHPFALRITGVGEIVISLRIVAERRIVLRRRERQRRAATPAPDELCRQQLALMVGLTVLSQEPVERSNSRLVFSRSEEHTSELQSPCNLVCRLLLEKKKNQNLS